MSHILRDKRNATSYAYVILLKSRVKVHGNGFEFCIISHKGPLNPQIILPERFSWSRLTLRHLSPNV